MPITPIRRSGTHQPSNSILPEFLMAESIKQALRGRAVTLRLEEGPAHTTLPLISDPVVKEENKQKPKHKNTTLSPAGRLPSG